MSDIHGISYSGLWKQIVVAVGLIVCKDKEGNKYYRAPLKYMSVLFSLQLKIEKPEAVSLPNYGIVWTSSLPNYVHHEDSNISSK